MKPIKFALAAAGVALASACAATAGDKSAHKMNETMMMKPHLVETVSSNEFTETLDRAKAAIDARGFKTFAVIDHAAGAASIGQSLRPTTLIIFGNPRGGTPLMLAEQRMGIRLPLKVLVYEDEAGAVKIAHDDIAHLFDDYGIGSLDGPKGKITGALGAIAAEAAAKPSAE